MNSSGDHASRRQAGLALKTQGDELMRAGAPENFPKVVSLCDEAIALLEDQPATEDLSNVGELASTWMMRAAALMNMQTQESSTEGLRSVDKAIDLLKALPLEGNSQFRYALAAAWLNRSDALMRSSGGKNLDDVVSAHKEAIALLEALPLAENELFWKRLAIAWMNCGVVLEMKKNETAMAEAAGCYQKVIELLDDPARTAADPGLGFLLAGACLNSANASLFLFAEAKAEEAGATAARAMSIVAEKESSEPEAADIGFKARHVYCRAMLALLTAAGDNTEKVLDFAGKVTDTIEDGLALARRWEAAGVAHFRGMATQLFHLGTLVYERCQPQFLADFITDYVDPQSPSCVLADSKEWFGIAGESLARLQQRIHGLDFKTLAGSESQKWVDILAGVRDAETRLKELREGLVATA